MKKEYIISVDMGGTKILTAVINSAEGIIGRVKTPTKISDKKPQYAKVIANSTEELLLETGIEMSQIKAICIGVPGSVNPETGVIGMAPNLGLKNYHLKDALARYFKCPILIENDVNLGALGILNYGVAKDKQNVLVVFVGTGIGGGLIFDGKLYRGSSFVAGEIGHIPIDPAGPLCGCGKKGCFETLASRTAIVRNITKDIKAGKRSILAKSVKNKVQIKSKTLLNALVAEDPVTVKHLTKAADTIGMVVAGLNNLLNLEMIVFGGGVMEAMRKYFIPRIRESFVRHSLKDASAHTRIIASKLLDDAAIYGGLALAEELADIRV